MKVQYEPVMLGVLALFLGNAFLGIPFFSGFPIDILSGVVNVFLLFYALIRRRLFRLQMLASPSLCYGVGFLFSILVFLNIVPSLQNLFHMRPDKNTQIYTLVFFNRLSDHLCTLYLSVEAFDPLRVCQRRKPSG